MPIDFTWKIAGEAGYGIMVTGLMFSRACMRAGAWTFDYTEYPSLIRGGHNTFQTRITDRKVDSQQHEVKLLVALDQKTIERHKDELGEDALVMFDPSSVEYDGNKIEIPFMEIVNKHEGEKIMRNIVALAASLALVGVDFQIVEEMIRIAFEKKGEEVVTQNLAIAKDGYDFVKDQKFDYKVPNATQDKRITLSGNDAFSMGAVKSGCKFLSTYPMTPATSVLHFFAAHEKDYSLTTKHTEDELAGLLMAIGAGHAGVRAMAATSGGGFALMAESLGLAGISETPVVVFVSMRPGPSTGLPTWTEQGDLRFMMHASQGDFPRVVLTPGDIEECFEAGLHAFNYAEKYQTPVIVLSDKYLSGSYQTIEPLKAPDGWKVDRGKFIGKAPEGYKRYEFTEDGISPRALTGTGVFQSFSNEHDEEGTEFTEDADLRNKQVEKRAKKMEVAAAEITDKIRYYGPEDADVTIFSWGSTKGPALEAMKLAEAEGLKVGLVHTLCVLPFPTEEMTAYLNKAKRPVLIEGNIEAQFGGVIRQYTGVEIKEKLLRYDGRPFYPEQILNFIKNG